MATSEYISYGIVVFAAITVIYVIYWSIRYRSIITVTKHMDENGNLSTSHSDISSCYDTESQTSDRAFFDKHDKDLDTCVQNQCSEGLCFTFPIGFSDNDS